MSEYSNSEQEKQPSQLLWRYALAGAILCGAFQTAMANTTEISANTSPFAHFKEFVANPPIIYAAIYKVIAAGDPRKGIQDSQTEGSPKDFVQYFFARWQPNCVFLKSGTNWDVAQSGRKPGVEINARFGAEHWNMEPNGLLTLWTDTAKGMSEIWMPPSFHYHNRMHQFREMMNMGIMQVEIGTVKWNDHDFTADGYVPESKTAVKITGKVTTDPAGFAKTMEVQYLSRENIYNYLIRYSYETNTGLPFLPSTIESFWMLNRKQIKLTQWDILSLSTHQSPLERSSFDLEKLFLAPGAPSIRYTNGHYYAKNPLGRWAAIVTPAGDVGGFRLRDASSAGNSFYSVAVVTSSLIAFSCIWRSVKNNKKNKNKKEMVNV